MKEIRSDKELEVSYMTIAQKMLDERRLGYAEGREEGIGLGREEALKENIAALKGLLAPAVIAERFQVSLERVEEILNQ